MRQNSSGNPVPHFWQSNSRGEPIHLKSIGRKYWKLIESFQPYKRGNKGSRSLLFLLQQLNNTDKHRLITVLATVVGGMRFTGLVGSSYFKIGAPIYINAKVGCFLPLPADGVLVLDDPPLNASGKLRTRIQKEITVNLDIIPGIKFGEGCNTVKRLPFLKTLGDITGEVSRIIELFAGEF